MLASQLLIYRHFLSTLLLPINWCLLHISFSFTLAHTHYFGRSTDFPFPLLRLFSLSLFVHFFSCTGFLALYQRPSPSVSPCYSAGFSPAVRAFNDNASLVVKRYDQAGKKSINANNKVLLAAKSTESQRTNARLLTVLTEVKMNA